MIRWILVPALLCCSSSVCGEKDRGPAIFALVVGANKSVDSKLKPLRYADDDAARYFELFRMLGARTFLLTDLDENTRRLHPQAEAEARPPDHASLEKAVGELAAELKKAQQRKVPTMLYFVFAGHGGAKGQDGYISLPDRHLTGRDIAEQILRPIKADTSHLIVDACNSYLLAFGRGPGGRRRSVEGFSQIAGVLMSDDVGMLLSTSSARESHEWQALQAGVFSHAVRSALYGAADADNNGRVDYREAAAFVQRANAAIPNDKYRSSVFARPPRYSPVLVDLRSRKDRTLEVGGKKHGRYLLEDGRGVRLADFHSAAGQTVHLMRPPAEALYLRRRDEEKEYAIPAADGPVVLASLQPGAPHSAHRGAAHQAFGRLFEMPFDNKVVEGYRFPRPPSRPQLVDTADQPSMSGQRIAAWTTAAVAAAALGVGVGMTVSAVSLRDGAPEGETHSERVERNEAIDARNIAAVTLYSLAGAAVATSALLFLWPEDDDKPTAAAVVGPGGGMLSLTGRF